MLPVLLPLVWILDNTKKRELVVCKVGLRTIILHDNVIMKHCRKIAYFYELN